MRRIDSACDDFDPPLGALTLTPSPPRPSTQDGPASLTRPASGQAVQAHDGSVGGFDVERQPGAVESMEVLSLPRRGALMAARRERSLHLAVPCALLLLLRARGGKSLRWRSCCRLRLLQFSNCC
jgi:hypothetical protein